MPLGVQNDWSAVSDFKALSSELPNRQAGPEVLGGLSKASLIIWGGGVKGGQGRGQQTLVPVLFKLS